MLILQLCLLGRDYLAAAQAGKGAVHFWAVRKEGAPLHRAFAMEPLCALAGAPSGSLVAGGGQSGAAYVWESASGRLLRAWPAGYKAITALAFSDDGSLLLTGGEDTSVACWNLARLPPFFNFVGCHRRSIITVYDTMCYNKMLSC